tara:strand:- start:2716 stop:3861 length:1146 start_codon:yes stop_codon:yes gene_type:complete
MGGKIYKILRSDDKATTKTLLHESIPVTGSLLSGTYTVTDPNSDENIKNYSHGMFQSVYDYPYLSSSANHIFDIAVGYSANSTLSASSGRTQQSKKINIYNQMAQVLAGHQNDGTIREFDEDGDLSGGTKIRECFFLNFSRLLTKDEIKKGSFELELGLNSAYSTAASVNFAKRIKITDSSGSNGYKVNSPAGEYGILYATSSFFASTAVVLNGETAGNADTNVACGLVYYQAGVAVISGSVFNDLAESGILHNSNAGTTEVGKTGLASGFNTITGSTIQTISDSIRNRIYNIQFNNTTELNSTVYFCRANHSEFNYSANPTYVSESKIQVKEQSVDVPVTYATSVGLYDARKRLVAVAKLSEPIKKTPENEVTFRVRLDY